MAHVLPPGPLHRMAAQARTLNDAGVIAICCGGPRTDRARTLVGAARFLAVEGSGDEIARAVEERLYPAAYGHGEGI